MPRPRPGNAAADSLSHAGRRVACKNCRQAKMRCDLAAGSMVPCARCRRMNRECKIDMEYKRINKHEKLEELENELRQLRSSMSTGPVNSKQPPTPTPQHVVSLNSQLPIQVNPNRADLIPGPPLSTSSGYTAQLSPAERLGQSPMSTKSLDNLTIEPNQVSQLFHIFFHQYHPHIPYLEPTTPPDAYYNKSPLLFWTITYIASRRYTEEPGLAVSLGPSVKKLLWEAIANPPHTLELVQSILLLCIWPFPTSSISTDNTVALVTTAQAIATRLGLHRPEAIRDFSRTNRRLSELEIVECLKTWVTCYIAYQSVAAVEVQLPLFSDWAIDRLSTQDSSSILSQVIYQQLKIYRFEVRVISSINGLPKMAEGVPRRGEAISLLSFFEQEFIDLGNSFGDQLTQENSILLDATGLRLYVFYLIEPSGNEIRKRALLRAFNLAIGIIQKFSILVTQRPNFTDCAPQYYWEVVSLGAMLILKIAFSNYSPFVDCDEGKHMYHTAAQLIRQLSLEDNDLPGRMSKILTQLWSVYARVGPIDEEPALRLKTRLSASLLHDILWCWRETFGGQGAASNNNTTDVSSVPQRNVYDNSTNSSFGAVTQNNELPCNLGDDDYLFVIPGFEDLLGIDLMSPFPLNFEGCALLPS